MRWADPSCQLTERQDVSSDFLNGIRLPEKEVPRASPLVEMFQLPIFKSFPELAFADQRFYSFYSCKQLFFFQRSFLGKCVALSHVEFKKN